MIKLIRVAKELFFAGFILLVCFACEKEEDKYFRYGTQERFNILKEELSEPPEVTIAFYWEPAKAGPLTEPPITSCLTTEVEFDFPYIIANGFKFHAFYWARTENELGDSPLRILSKRMAFNNEKDR